MFIAAVFTIAKTWKQPKCPPTDEWIKVMWGVCIHNTMEYYSAIIENETPICSNIGAQAFIILSQSKEKYHMISFNVESKIWYK